MVNGYAPDVLFLTGCQPEDRNEPCGIQLTELIVSRYYFKPATTQTNLLITFPAEFFALVLIIYLRAESLLFLP